MGQGDAGDIHQIRTKKFTPSIPQRVLRGRGNPGPSLWTWGMHVPLPQLRARTRRGAGHTSVGAKVASPSGDTTWGSTRLSSNLFPGTSQPHSVLALPERSPLTFAEAEKGWGPRFSGGHISQLTDPSALLTPKSQKTEICVYRVVMHPRITGLAVCYVYLCTSQK